MDFPGSWSLVKKNLPALVGYAAGSFVENYRQGARARRAIDADRKGFDTWSERPPARSRRMVRVSGKRRMKRSYRRRVRISRSPRQYDVVVRNSQKLSFAGAAGTYADVYGFVSFKLNDVANFAEITSMYSAYRIKKLVCKFIPRNDTANGNGNGTTAVSTQPLTVLVATEKSTSTTPVNAADLLTYGDMRILNLYGGRPATHTVWYPAQFNTVAGANVSLQRDWISTADAALLHYGMRYAGLRMSNAMIVDVIVQYHIEVMGFKS